MMGLRYGNILIGLPCTLSKIKEFVHKRKIFAPNYSLPGGLNFLIFVPLT